MYILEVVKKRFFVNLNKTYDHAIKPNVYKYCRFRNFHCISTCRKLRGNKINQIHINLSISLFIAYIIFLAGVEARRSTNLNSCLTIAFFLQFFFLSAWGWMAAECFTMYKSDLFIFVYVYIFQREF